MNKKSYSDRLKDIKRKDSFAEIKNKLLKMTLSGELMSSEIAHWKNKLIIDKSTGGVIYILNPKERFETRFSTKSNSFLLLNFLAQYPKSIFSWTQSVKAVNKPRAGGQDSTDERRIRDTAQTIRGKLKLPIGIDIFRIDKGIGLNCLVEIRS